MHYLEVKRVRKIISFLRMIISHLDAHKSGEEKFRVICNQKDVFHHLFYENNRIDPTLIIAFDVEKIGSIIHTIEVCAQAASYANEEMRSPRISISMIALRISLQSIIYSRCLINA